MRHMRRVAVFLVLVFLVAPLHPAAAATEGFKAWLMGLRHDARAQGITEATLNRSLDGLQPIPRVIQLDRNQPETTLTFDQYIDRVVSPARRAAASKHYAEHKALLDAIGQRYGVQPRYIVALWGIETDFGRNMGSYPVIAALATLAYEGRRTAFFRCELINALQIVQDDHIDPATMTGSWAGAMGQSQFMPSSFLAYAVSYRGNRPPDIWHRLDDVFASIANYLSRSGWRNGEGWGERVKLPRHLDPSRIGLDERKSLSAWAALGVRRAGGGALPRLRRQASLIEPGGSDGPDFLVFNNFRVLLRWNSSSYFAVAVGYLADSVK